jgi:hypothetical protein
MRLQLVRHRVEGSSMRLPCVLLDHASKLEGIICFTLGRLLIMYNRLEWAILIWLKVRFRSLSSDVVTVHFCILTYFIVISFCYYSVK